MIYIGLPQWSHPKWVRLGITDLEAYARHFNCVEGNTTLYALPKADIVATGYDLSINRYKEVVHEATEHRSPREIIVELKALEKEIAAELDELEAML